MKDCDISVLSAVAADAAVADAGTQTQKKHSVVGEQREEKEKEKTFGSDVPLSLLNLSLALSIPLSMSL
jgi:hypothetical protein